MVAIAPFRALRYNLARVGDFSRVVAPPYDVISPEEQARLYDVSPHNIIRLILGTQSPDDTDADNRYTRAKQTYEQWSAEQVLVRDAQPAIYVIDHTFTPPHGLMRMASEKSLSGSLASPPRSDEEGFRGAGFTWQGQPRRRVGLIALLELTGSVAEQVWPHEATFGAPKADRTRLLDAVGAQLSPIFCVLPDPAGCVRNWLQEAASHAPASATAILPQEEVRVWAVTDPAVIARVQQEAASRSVLIADGHHRFEVALSRRDRYPDVMTYFACLEDPAMVVWPIHRVVSVPPALEASWTAHREVVCEMAPAISLEELLAWLHQSPDHGCFGYAEAGRLYRASLRRDVLAKWLLHPSVALPLAGLDVSMLHEVILKPLAGQASADAWCQFTPDPQRALAMADRLAHGHAWLVRPIPLTQVFALAAQQIRLPQKSTYFYPKVLSGLCINPCT